MFFSIIIPLYNKAAYIEKAVHSVLSQTFNNFELIVVDDGSTDNGPEIVKSLLLTDYHSQLITQANQGVSTARNNGVKVAKGDYIAFLDADDWWEPTFLEQMNLLINAFPAAGIYGSSYFKVKNGKIMPANIGVDKNFEKGTINYFKVYARTLWMPLWTGSTIVLKKIFEEENGFKPQLKLGEDFDLWVRIAQKYSVAYINRPLAYYNQDVVQAGRAIGAKLYQPEEHMLFAHYGELMQNVDFKYLFDRLAVYSLLPYYLNKINTKEVTQILNHIDWKIQEAKYVWYYKRLPRWLVKWYFDLKNIGSKFKKKFKF